MPLKYAVDHARQRVLIKGRDPIKSAEVISLFDRQAADSAWAYGTLKDLRGVVWVPSTLELRYFLNHIRTLSRELGCPGPVALIVADNLMVETFRRYSLLGEHVNVTIKVFPNVGDAEKWLAGV
jgi:hypothetical protein